MKREPSILAHSLRAVALVITLVSLVTFSTVGYTAYADVSDVLNTVGGGAPTSAITAGEPFPTVWSPAARWESRPDRERS